MQFIQKGYEQIGVKVNAVTGPGSEKRGNKQSGGDGTLAALSGLSLRADPDAYLSLLFTDVGRDGMLKGVNLEATLALAAVSPVPVIASGGVAGLADIEALAGQPNIEAYSAMKKTHQRKPEYSVRKPATSSLSASARSKGARLTLATAQVM